MTDERRPVVVVDVANLVGSVPDGWWRDRPAATARVLAGLARVATRGTRLDTTDGAAVVVPPGSRWLVVLEGGCRDLEVPPPLEAVRAEADGDTAVVETARQQPDVVVVSADRGLRQRLPEGVGVTGPRRLRLAGTDAAEGE